MGHLPRRDGNPGLQAMKQAQALYAREVQAKFIRKVAEGLPPPEPAKVAIRAWKPEDLNLIIDSWASSYRFSPEVQYIDPDVYKVEQRSRIYRLVTRSRILVANREGCPDDILGWVCFEPPVALGQLPIVHYVLVQRSVQLQGIATSLIELCRKTASEPDSPMWGTHHTAPMRHLRRKWQVMHNTYLLEHEQHTPGNKVHGTY
jgi:hypothetical protein